MLDKQLCKWIHKKDITVGDIFNKFAPFAILLTFICILLIDAVFRQAVLLFTAFVSTAVVTVFTVWFIVKTTQKFAKIKVAHCPNAKDETKEE